MPKEWKKQRRPLKAASDAKKTIARNKKAQMTISLRRPGGGNHLTGTEESTAHGPGFTG